MSSLPSQQSKKRDGERGSVVIMTAVAMLITLLFVGLAIDVSRIYMMKAELQNAADAAALTAARELNGGTGGIDDAVTRANAIINTQGFAKTGVTIASVEFAINLNDDPYMSAAAAKDASVVADIRFVKVTTQSASVNILFAVKALGDTHTQSSQAVAGMSVGLNGICDFFPAAVALDDADPDDEGYTLPDEGALMTLNFNQGTGNEAVLNHEDYIILEVPDINGNGQIETALLTAGVPNFCKQLGDNINMTPSSNPGNGPRAAGEGLNTRFNVYANGYGNQLNPTNFKPDSNIKEFIPYLDYKNKATGQVTTPNPNGPGVDDRRVIVAPIILPGTYPAYTTNIQAWGVFFLKSKVPTPNGNCSNIPGCGDIPVEYVRRALVGSAYGEPTEDPTLTIPVLYK